MPYLFLGYLSCANPRYSPLMPHRTQKMLSGSRLSLSGSLYEPNLLIPWATEWLDEVDDIPLPAPPELGACWDRKSKEWHGNLNWQSAKTRDISEAPSACFPQVFPQPQDNWNIGLCLHFDTK